MQFGYDAFSNRAAQRWYKKFPSADLSLIDELPSGRPKIVSDEDLKEVVKTISSTTFNVSDETVRLDLHQLRKTWKLSDWVPDELSKDSKLSLLTICSAKISRHHNESFLDRLLRRQVDVILKF
ncbi:hypothetical protein Trydic_g12992 [Trypoxylus dichotomus]